MKKFGLFRLWPQRNKQVTLPDAVIQNERYAKLHVKCRGLNQHAILKQAIEQTRFVVIDSEATGFHAYADDELVSISLIELQGLHKTGREYYSLINPGRPIPSVSTEIHGIIDADVKDAPHLSDIICDILEFIDLGVIVGHHINFDLRFLNKALTKTLDLHLCNPWLDTMLLYVEHSGRIGHYSLEEVAHYCNVNITERHSARGDALATAGIFTDLTKRLVKPSQTVGALIKHQYNGDI